MRVCKRGHVVDESNAYVIRRAGGKVSRWCRRCTLDRQSARMKLVRSAARPARLAARFWAKVDTSGGPDACWPWTGSVTPKGYGRVRRGNALFAAHRMAWELSYGGPVLDRLSVCHTCDHPPCCNPAHLFLGTNADNTADIVVKGRQSKGERVAKSKLTDFGVAAARAAYLAGGVSIRRLAADYGVSGETLRKAIRRETWRHVA